MNGITSSLLVQPVGALVGLQALVTARLAVLALQVVSWRLMGLVVADLVVALVVRR